MKKLAIIVGGFFVVLSLLVYFNKSYQYEKFVVKPKSTVVHKYQINVNLADWYAYDNLPGIGPKLAKAIVEDRETRGRFNSIEDIKRVKGIGEKKFAEIQRYLTMEVL